MLEVTKYSMQGEEIGKVALPETLFNVRSKNPEALLYEVINMYLANQRQGTKAVKTRAEVHGSSRKLFRQKGTGNARVGNIRTPIRVGGGNAFGPKPKDWHKNIPKKKKRLALKLALTQRAQNNQIVILESLDFEKPETKKAKLLLEKVVPEKSKSLIIIDGNDKKIIKSFNNLPRVSMDKADSIYAYEILKSNFLILTEDALKKIEEVFAQ